MLARPPYHHIRNMPRCRWAGHRYDFLREENGMVIEICMDCGGRPRTYPVGSNSSHATVIEFPVSELDQLIGKESRL